MSTIQRTPPQEPVASPSPPAEPAITQQERETLREVLRLVAERAAAEAGVDGANSSRNTAADQQYQDARKALVDKYEGLKDQGRRDDEAGRRAIVNAAITGEKEAKSEFARASRRIASEFDSLRDQARNDHARARSEAASAFDTGERAAHATFAEARRPIDEASSIIESMRARLDAIFADYQRFGLKEASTTPTRETYRFTDLVGALFDRLAKAEPDLALLEGLWIPKAMKGNRYVWIIVVLFLLLVYPFVLSLGPIAGPAVAVVVAIGFGFGLRTWLYSLSKKQVSRLYYPLHQTIIDGEALAAHCLAAATDHLAEQRTQAAQARDEAVQVAKHKHTKTISSGEALRDERLRRINEIYAERMVEIQTQQQTEMRAAIESYEQTKVEIQTHYEASTQRLDEKYRDIKEKIQARHESSWTEMVTRWREGMERTRGALEEIHRTVDAFGPRWDDPAWNDRPFPRLVPPVVRFGEVRIDLDQLPQGVSADPRLMEGISTSYTFPALLPFPDRANLLIETPAQGRAAAIGLLQAAMMRVLTSLPPGQVRFTIIDPLGIGRNFGAFMHLADFDEALVTNQVWTETRQIEERLADLSTHMERVTQRYLRNEYASIEEYNAVAGEVAEPYRVLVIADFPTNFDERGASRLASIAAGGVPCGVSTLVAVDIDRPLPAGLVLDDLRANALNLTWNGSRLATSDPDFGQYPLVLDQLPPAETATRLIHRAGAAARDARRVEVPFEFIAPSADAWWTQDSRAGIDVALGKAGATKRQNLTLGQGTSQHVLIAGRTGSGKSTLLHALITNLALNYSPDQVDLYLIDFKKGVEFKVYATHELPHASVVAIESEREFGISVLQRLDAEMRDRAERFREVGVQDVNGYRNTPGTPPLPRMLLIVDEFQEFFVEEDKVAQEAALLLDRLVRQGRAFGIHIHLGSQSLGGAYALARSTLGQMAVRIALQCSEADAHLILSEQNSAARLLSRPGEAVYNDANGLEEGNHFFQVVWLPDERRESYLKQLSDLARERKPILARTPIVFEGDAPADLARNLLLKPLIEAPAWPTSPRSAQAWLGDAVAIKDPTSALFRRQGGNHLLIVGQNDEAALGIMTSALIGLAAQFPPAASDTVRSGARFAILDGTPEDHPQTEFLSRVAGALPHPIAVGNWRDAARILAELALEIERRQQPDSADGPEIFLFIHDLPRFRDLRRREDDFGFSRKGEEAGPPDHLSTILREGSGLGIHILTWCDNLNNLNRYFDHQGLREFGMRVLFQMSPTDSGHLLDSPHASRLGPHRAFFSSEEQNRLEKFRPYGLPAEAWLNRVRDQFRKRGAAEGEQGAGAQE
ncbi:MAG TPA: FtsK/SpoIIIE domain-containing protein [Isosphaeraceae bacterium]|nr:FtsK/SpoIIIE domain-containing protein [Isosphaeraceae bacterium]